MHVQKQNVFPKPGREPFTAITLINLHIFSNTRMLWDESNWLNLRIFDGICDNNKRTISVVIYEMMVVVICEMMVVVICEMMVLVICEMMAIVELLDFDKFTQFF
jgi:hypothetical protein